MKSLIAVLLLAIPTFAHAAPPNPPSEAERAEHARRMRTRITIELADALRLDNAAALKLSSALDAALQKQEPLHQRLRESMQTIRAAANDDAAALAKLDEAVKTLHESRRKLVENEAESFAVITKDLTPVQRARFLVTVARHFRMGHGPEGHGHGGGRGPGERRGPGDRGERRWPGERGTPSEAPSEKPQAN